MSFHGVGPVADLTTPALLIDLQRLEQNITSMATWAAGRVGLRPHAKAHKCIEIARRQHAAGALGVTTATVWEALAMARAGVGEILLSSQTVVDDKLSVLAEAATHADLLVALDSVAAADRLSDALPAGVRAGVLIELDVGMGRGGVRSIEAASALAHHLARIDRLELRGVMGYEGHTVLETDAGVRAEGANAAMRALSDCASTLRDAGYAIDIVSGGGTNTYDITGVHPDVTEIQAGTYALMDTAYQPFAPRFDPALSILGTVVNRHDDRVVLDCGTKVIGSVDFAAPRPRAADLRLCELHEEHALLDVLEGPGPILGDRVELIASYCGGTANLNDRYYLVEHDMVVDVWPIIARGSGPFA